MCPYIPPVNEEWSRVFEYIQLVEVFSCKVRVFKSLEFDTYIYIRLINYYVLFRENEDKSWDFLNRYHSIIISVDRISYYNFKKLKRGVYLDRQHSILILMFDANLDNV